MRVRPYKSIKLEFMAKEMNISVKDVRALCAELILDKRINA